MRAIKRTVAAVLVLALAAGILPVQAFAYRVERVCDSDGYCYRRIIHDDGTVTVVDDGYRDYYYSPRYYSSYYSSDPYYYSYDYPYYGSGYYYRGGSRVGAVLGGAALGYAIGRGFRHHR